MKAHALVPALVLAAALLAPPVADAASRHRSDRGRRPPAHGYYGHRPSYRPSYGYHGYRYRTPRPYYRTYRYYSAPYGYYGDGYGYGYGYGGYGYGGYGYDGYGYGTYPPPPPSRYCPPRPRVGFWFGF
jgi:hypothetical protein